MTLGALLARIRALPIVADALTRLGKGLPSSLCYHSASHTEDVLQEALLFGLHDKLEPRALELIGVAAAYHDLGFLERSTDNETIGARLAGEAMDRFGGFSPDEQQLIKQAILDTQVKMTPEGPRQISNSWLSNYLLDADVSNLGRADFFEKAELVRRELGLRSSRIRPEGVASERVVEGVADGRLSKPVEAFF